MVWSIKLFFLGLIFITTLNSCESYARFFITNNVDTTFVVVKVNAIYNLPKDYISLNTVDYKNFS